MSELYSLPRGAPSRLAAELHSGGKISAERVAAILNDDSVSAPEPTPPAAAFSDDDEHEELYDEWAALSGIPRDTASVSPEAQAEAEAFQREVAEADRELEAERQRRADEEAEADRL